MEEPTLETFEIEKPTPPFKTAAKWGAIIGGTAIVFILVKYLAAGNYIIGVPFEFILMIVLLGFGAILAQLDHKKSDLDGKMAYGRALGIGILASIIGIALYAAVDSVFFAYILDEVTINEAYNYSMDKTLEFYESNNIEFPEDKMSLLEKGMRKGLTASGRFKSNLLTYGIISFIIVLISSIFTRSKN